MYWTKLYIGEGPLSLFDFIDWLGSCWGNEFFFVPLVIFWCLLVTIVYVLCTLVCLFGTLLLLFAFIYKWYLVHYLDVESVTIFLVCWLKMHGIHPQIPKSSLPLSLTIFPGSVLFHITYSYFSLFFHDLSYFILHWAHAAKYHLVGSFLFNF